jgi:hypothetical protein
MKRDAGRETWHRLLEWDRSSADSERLAAILLSMEEEYKGVDPSHPLGGPDGKRDLLVMREGKLWIGATYFPRGKKPFSEIKEKFTSDIEAIKKHNAAGFVFITNQEVTLSERYALKDSLKAECDIFHLERIAGILNQPKGYGMRLEFLNIEMSKEEQIAVLCHKDELIERLIAQITKLQIGNSDSKVGHPIEVVPEPIKDVASYSLGISSNINFCSQCGFGYKVKNDPLSMRVYSYGEGYSITCPKCGNIERYNKPLI